MFGAEICVDEPLVPPLSAYNGGRPEDSVPQLFAVAGARGAAAQATVPSAGDATTTAATTGDLKSQLHNLNHSLCFHFMELLDSLTQAPSRFHDKLAHLKVLFANFHYLLNTYRPHQVSCASLPPLSSLAPPFAHC